jgi:hypothetical protein
LAFVWLLENKYAADLDSSEWHLLRINHPEIWHQKLQELEPGPPITAEDERKKIEEKLKVSPAPSGSGLDIAGHLQAQIDADGHCIDIMA